MPACHPRATCALCCLHQRAGLSLEEGGGGASGSDREAGGSSQGGWWEDGSEPEPGGGRDAPDGYTEGPEGPGGPDPAAALLDELLLLGFAEGHARRALAACGRGAGLVSALDWLCINVPEEELPVNFAPGERVFFVHGCVVGGEFCCCVCVCVR